MVMSGQSAEATTFSCWNPAARAPGATPQLRPRFPTRRSIRWSRCPGRLHRRARRGPVARPAGVPWRSFSPTLRNSTALYERMGDADAYEIVRRHFAFLSDVILGRNGTVVKTIGDAMMAAFDDPFDAVEVALSVQAAHADENRGHQIALRLGVHAGECVRIALGNCVDYFGSTVNLAAKLRARSKNGDVVLSHVVAGFPEIERLLATLPTREESLPIRGVNGLVHLVRVMPANQQVIGNGSALSVEMADSARPAAGLS